jgi:hypothetical protein
MDPIQKQKWVAPRLTVFGDVNSLTAAPVPVKVVGTPADAFFMGQFLKSSGSSTPS